VAALPDIGSPAGLQAALAAPGLLLLDVYTQNCIICRHIEPMVAAAAASSGGAVRAYKIDAEAHQQFAVEHDIRGVPTILLFHDGRVVGRRSGFLTAQALREWLRREAGPLIAMPRS
jgi:thioredoxin-like negative regulator of GroEL